MTKRELAAIQPVEALIREIRGERGILGNNHVRICRVRTKRLNEQVRRNPERFPPDCLFRITPSEA